MGAYVRYMCGIEKCALCAPMVAPDFPGLRGGAAPGGASVRQNPALRTIAEVAASLLFATTYRCPWHPESENPKIRCSRTRITVSFPFLSIMFRTVPVFLVLVFTTLRKTGFSD